MFSTYQQYDAQIADCITTSAANRLIFCPPKKMFDTRGDPVLEQTFCMRILLDLPHLSAKQKAESKVPGSLIFNWKSKIKPQI